MLNLSDEQPSELMGLPGETQREHLSKSPRRQRCWLNALRQDIDHRYVDLKTGTGMVVSVALSTVSPA